MIDNLIQAFFKIFSFKPMLYIFLGVPFGLIVGAIPGLTAVMAITLLLPFTLVLGSTSGFALLIAVYTGGVTGGLISAILLKMPGTPSSISTVLDGYALTEQGKPGRALSLGLASSLAGGFISAIFLTFTAPFLGRYAIQIGYFEIFSLTFFAIIAVSAISEGSFLKGIISSLIGLILSMVGADPVAGVIRYNFEWQPLNVGFKLLPVMIGLFAFSKILTEVENYDLEVKLDINKKIDYLWPNFKEILDSRINIIRSALIGIWVGMLPGIGGATAGLISYSQAKNFSKEPEKFGKGSEEGIIASEVANNATIGGALLPLLVLGIPGNASTAALLGGLMIHGVRPGPLLFRSTPQIAYAIFISLFISNIIMYFWAKKGMKIFVSVLKLSKEILLPSIIVFCVVGSFALNNSMFDVWVLLFFGILAYLLDKTNFPILPLMLGILLGPIAEYNLRCALSQSNGDITPLFTRPVSLICVILAIFSVLWNYYLAIKRKK